MALGLLGIRLFLAAVFVLAVVGKVRQQTGFRRTLAGFGVPAWAVGPASLVIPSAEAGVAVLLVPAMSAWWGAGAGLLVLTVFTAAVGANLARGRRPDCRCFGAATAAPIGPATLVRNGALAGCATILLIEGPGAGLDSPGAAWRLASGDERFLVLVALVLLVALVATTLQVGHLRRHNARLTARADNLERQLRPTGIGASSRGGLGLPVGAEAPSFVLPRLEGDRASLDALRAAGLPVLLVFSSAYCPACAHLWPDIERWQQEYASVLTVAAICGGPSQMIEMKLLGLEVRNVLLQSDAAVSDLYNLSTTPSALVVGADGSIDSEVAEGVPAIRALADARARG